MSMPSHSGLTPESLFAAWLARHEAGEQADFEAVCREHPDAAAELHDLHGHWSKVEAVRRQHGLGGSLSEKLKTQYGSGVDPQVTLEGEEQVRGDFSSEVLSRLAGRGPASTRYRVKGEVAHGGMGAVLRVWDEDLRRCCARRAVGRWPDPRGSRRARCDGQRVRAVNRCVLPSQYPPARWTRGLTWNESLELAQAPRLKRLANPRWNAIAGHRWGPESVHQVCAGGEPQANQTREFPPRTRSAVQVPRGELAEVALQGPPGPIRAQNR